jgi:hypothetical protein
MADDLESERSTHLRPGGAVTFGELLSTSDGSSTIGPPSTDEREGQLLTIGSHQT